MSRQVEREIGNYVISGLQILRMQIVTSKRSSNYQATEAHHQKPQTSGHLVSESSREMWCDTVPLQFEAKEDFKQFTYSPLCSYSSDYHRNKEVKNYLLNVAVSGTASVLKGLAAASIRYQQREEATNDREIISLSSSVYARKGFLVCGKEGLAYYDKGMKFKMEGLEIGLEEILIVTTEVER